MNTRPVTSSLNIMFNKDHLSWRLYLLGALLKNQETEVAPLTICSAALIPPNNIYPVACVELSTIFRCSQDGGRKQVQVINQKILYFSFQITLPPPSPLLSGTGVHKYGSALCFIHIILEQIFFTLCIKIIDGHPTLLFIFQGVF
jgi:hypothetical protein